MNNSVANSVFSFSRRQLFKLSVLAFAGLSSLTAIAAPDFVPPAPAIAGRAYIVNDFYSNTTLASVDADKRVEPASLTKLMTAYLTFKAVKEGKIKLDQALVPSVKAWKIEGSRMFVEPNKPVRVDDLIKGMIVQSGNDACITLAEAIAGSEETFAHMMNDMAKKLGMKNTHFMNATGLPNADHYTTARDLSILAARIIRDFPEFFPIYSMKDFTYNGVKQPNRNLLLWRDPNVDGMKTGHTNSAGFCLVGTMKRDGRRVVSVVLGTANEEARATESLKLLNYGIQFFDTPKLYAKGQAIQQVKVWKGSEESLGVGFLQDFYMTLPKGAASRVKVKLVTQQPLIAPVVGGQKVGQITFSLDGKALGTYPVVALKQVSQAGVWGRMKDSVKLWFE
ncbi:D-alanyl-D-alanine carboxypeptidase [Leeia sp. TBRC 13508]|uniref:serine-type D-Ala-D-Ala carboxypeptidase n=1 Tax=Leeia speluncae TaxID=2884804 RepID=A0ABS8D7R7_9NEIS|nr:D-alanyl-D-alanine carboxypeptidase family protein [Leeia speluncae]MCB6184031.1 D-alanyl-D-alanine carboxypeptidase [Leeia speluncae]